MSKFGTGFGKDKIFLDARPCNRLGSAQHQKLKNQWFQKDGHTGNKFKDDRPNWWRGKRPASSATSAAGSSVGDRPPSPTRLGEWALVWRPKGAPTPPGPKPRSAAARVPAKAGKEHNELLASIRAPSRSAKYVSSGDSMSGIIREAKPGTSQSEKQKQSRPDVPQSRLSTSQSGKGHVLQPRSASAEPRPVSSRGGSARSFKIPIHKAVPDVFDVESQPALQSGRSTVSNLSRASRRSARTDISFRSTSSAGTYSGLSGVSSQFDQEEILRRIQGLEDALRAEKNLRQKMQTIIESTTGGGLGDSAS